MELWKYFRLVQWPQGSCRCEEHADIPPARPQCADHDGELANSDEIRRQRGRHGPRQESGGTMEVLPPQRLPTLAARMPPALSRRSILKRMLSSFSLGKTWCCRSLVCPGQSGSLRGDQGQFRGVRELLGELFHELPQEMFGELLQELFTTSQRKVTPGILAPFGSGSTSTPRCSCRPLLSVPRCSEDAGGSVS